MKKLLLIILCVSTCYSFAHAQKVTPLTPVYGYYKSLLQFDDRPASANETIDKEKYPYDPAIEEKRLSLKPYYLKNVTLNDFVIPDPPANSSEQTRAELNYLLALQQQRTSLDIESSLYMAGVYYNVRTTPEDAKYEHYRRNLFHIGRSIGSWFNATDLPLTAALMAHVWQDASFFIWSAKYKYLRIRPYKIDTDIKNLEETNWPAYPSGHAANSYINAFIYQELAPEYAGTFIKDAYDMAHSREIIGVHYPSDSESARQLAHQFVVKLFQNEQFRKDFDAAKKEWTLKAKESFNRPAIVKPEGSQKPASCSDKCD